MDLSKGMYFVFLCTLFVGVLCVSPPPREVKCKRVSHCSCTMSDMSGHYDLSSLSSGSGTPEPYFNRFPGRNSSESFSYDPCFPFSFSDAVIGGETACDNVAGCRIDALSTGSEKKTYTNIAKHSSVEFHYDEAKETMVVKYPNDDSFHPMTTEVHLNCLSPSKPTMIELIKATAIAVSFRLSSPNACLIPTPSGGLSAGSILCILFSLSFIIYFVGGTVVSVFIQNKPFSDAIPPNKDFWLDLPSLIKDGANFAMSGFKAAPPTHQRLGGEEDHHVYHDDDANDDEEIDELKVKPGGGPSEASDGFTAVAV